MKILLTNDDGYDAPGIERLREVCGAWGEVTVVAPAGAMSGVGHAVTTSQPLALREHDAAHFSLSGTPADCVRVGLRELVPDTDWVVAGINAGGNMGADAYTSGTLAAVREAALLGWPALALSQYVAPARPIDWEGSGRRAQRVLEDVLARPREPEVYWNANLPHPEDERRVCAVVEAPLDPSPMLVRYRRVDDHFHWGGDYHERPREPGSDVDVCFSGEIALTRLPVRIPHP